jgi:uncharacterized protein (TIGR02118 family)
MIKAIYFIKRKPGMALAAFREYWLKDHAALVLKVPGIVKYTQSHTTDSGYRNHEPVYDGVAALWYENLEVMKEIADASESRSAAADDANFIDLSKFGFILTREYVQKENPIECAMPKLVAFLKRKPGMSVADFQARWRAPHGRLGSAVPGVRRYVQCHPLASAYRDNRIPTWDGVAETWFDSDDAMRAGAATPEYKALRDDEPHFLAENPKFIIATEHVIV